MAQIVKLKRSSTAGSIPTTGSLVAGELAINTNDGKVYFERDDGSATVQSILTTNTQIPITGSLNLSGSATYIVGVTGSINTAGSGRVYEQGSSVVDTAMAFSIVFGG